MHACSPDGAHGVTYELAWRHLEDTSRRASPAVRHQLGDQLKSSLAYSFRHSTLDSDQYPMNGWGFRCGPFRNFSSGTAPASTCKRVAPLSCHVHLHRKAVSCVQKLRGHP